MSDVGAVSGTRTRDPQLGKLMLYQLSYYRRRVRQINRKRVQRYNNYFIFANLLAEKCIIRQKNLFLSKKSCNFVGAFGKCASKW